MSVVLYPSNFNYFPPSATSRAMVQFGGEGQSGGCDCQGSGQNGDGFFNDAGQWIKGAVNYLPELTKKGWYKAGDVIEAVASAPVKLAGHLLKLGSADVGKSVGNLAGHTTKRTADITGIDAQHIYDSNSAVAGGLLSGAVPSVGKINPSFSVSGSLTGEGQRGNGYASMSNPTIKYNQGSRATF